MLRSAGGADAHRRASGSSHLHGCITHLERRPRDPEASRIFFVRQCDEGASDGDESTQARCIISCLVDPRLVGPLRAVVDKRARQDSRTSSQAVRLVIAQQVSLDGGAWLFRPHRRTASRLRGMMVRKALQGGHAIVGAVYVLYW